MRKTVILLLLVFFLASPVSAAEFTAPTVPESVEDLMPDRAESFGEGLFMILKDVIPLIRPDLKQAAQVCLAVIAITLMISLLQGFSEPTKQTADLAGTAAAAAAMLYSTNSMIHLAADTITELSEYGKLLLPVMTAAMAAQGGVTTSTALYAGTAVFDTVLSSMISKLLVPMVYLFLALSLANSAVGEDLLKKMRDFINWLVSWCLKTSLTVFTGYMALTGVLSGTADASALKATKAAISTVVPVVGGILSNASEAVLISAGLAKNAAGIYGILAILAVFAGPFLQIGAHYLLLKATASLCGIFGTKRIIDLISDFSAAMGLLLAMTGSVCLLLLISTVCFMKGVG